MGRKKSGARSFFFFRKKNLAAKKKRQRSKNYTQKSTTTARAGHHSSSPARSSTNNKKRTHKRTHLLLFGYKEVEHEAILRERLRLSQEHLQPTPAAGAVVRQRLVASGPGAGLDETVGEELLAVVSAEKQDKKGLEI